MHFKFYLSLYIYRERYIRVLFQINIYLYPSNGIHLIPLIYSLVCKQEIHDKYDMKEANRVIIL